MNSPARRVALASLVLLFAAAVASGPLAAQPTELFISEYIEGSSNNKALEFYNGTGAAIDLAAGGYNVQMFFNGAATASLTINLTGTVANGDVFVLAHASANATILAQADQTNGSGWYNGDDAVTLRKGTTIIDSIGVVGTDPGSEWGTGLTSTADNTLRRKPGVCAGDTNAGDAFDPATEWDGFAVDTFDGLGSHTVTCRAPVINEFSASTTGTDVEFVEVFGPPSTDLSTLTILEVEGDFSGTVTGTIDEVVAVGTTDANGFWLGNLAANALENGTLTLLLVEGFSGALGNDLDTNDDGVLDVNPWTRIVDSVSVNDGGATDLTYGVPVLGVSYDGQPFAPGGASRIPDGADTDAAANWVRNDFDLAGIPGFTGTPVFGEAYNTPGATNVAVPAELAPTVVSTSPANGAVGVAASTNLTVTFSEDVTAAAGAFTLQCGAAPPVVLTVSGGPLTFTLDPTTDLPLSTTCTATVVAANVTDQDGVAPANMAADYVFSFTTAAPVVLTPIHDIQGNGLASAYDGLPVTTSGVVTGLKFNNGFFLQEPDATIDADPLTSEGIFVYTGSAPTVAVGDFVQVSGTLDEYAPGYGSLTEIVSPTVSVISSGNPLPATIDLTAALPSTAGPWEQLEHLEAMRVRVPGFTVGSATDGNPADNYTTGSSNGVFYGVVTGVSRPAREEGIAFPNNPPAGTTIPPLLRWDSNPELIRVDSDGLVGATRMNYSARTVLPAFTGPLDYAFNRYSVLPDPGTLPAAPAEFEPTAVTAPLATEFTVASYNLQRFYDDVDDPAFGSSYEAVLSTAQFTGRLAKASLGIRDYMRTPDVVGVVEVENLSTLQALATRINSDAVAASQPDPLYQAYLIEGNDVGAIDVGFLVKTSLVGGAARVEVLSVTQELDGTLFTNLDASTETLNDRPPLMLRALIHSASGAAFPVTVIVNHLRSMKDVDSDAAGSLGWPTIGARVRAKRQAQAVDLANLVQARQVADPTERIVLVGDFNAFSVNDSLGDLIATIAGTPAADATTAVPGDGADLVNPDLVNVGVLAPAAERYSYVYDGAMQMIDHALVNSALVGASAARRVEYARINADFPEIDRTAPVVRLSDHDPLVLYVEVPAFATAGLSTTIVDAPDPVFAGAGLGYTITVTNAGPDAATGLTMTAAVPAGTLFASLTTPAGWSCTTPAVGGTGTVSCTATTLAAAANAVFTLNVTVAAGTPAGTVITATATVTQTSAEATPGDESATTTTTVQTAAALFATKSAGGSAVPGGTVTYTITLTNGGGTAQLDNPGDEVVDVLPPALTLVSAIATSGTAVANVGTNTVTWNGSIPAGGTVTITITATVSSSALPGTTVSNQARVAFDADGNGTNEAFADSDDPATPASGDPTVFAVAAAAAAAATIPTLDGLGLGLLALLVALGGALVLGRRLG